MSENSTLSAKVTWLRGLAFDGQARQHHLLTDSRVAGGEDRGPSPMELLLIALAGCTAMDVVSILNKQRQPFSGCVVECEGERAAEHPKRFTSLKLRFRIEGAGLDREAVERAVQLSLERYCSVLATLSHPPVVSSDIVLDEEPP